jgi:hypothetical protein
MADLHEHLKEIETAPPPDLWAGIEARAKEEGPEMDTNITSIHAFRTRGQEQWRRIAAGLVAAAVVAAVAVVAWQSFRAPTTTTGPGVMPEGWVRCTNSELGYSIGYPGAWHTTDVLNGEANPANTCRWFSPDGFGPEGNVVLEGWGYPLEIAFGGRFDPELQQVLDPELTRVVEQEALAVEGHRAVRIEYETLVDAVADTGLHYQYLVSLDRRTTLIVHTSETRGIAGDYEENRTVVDQAVETLEFTNP